MPKPSSSRTATVSLDLIALPEGISGLRCSECGSPMESHQPDLEQPDRLLLTCGECKDWFLMDRKPGEDQAVMTLLPDAGHSLGGLGAWNTSGPLP